MGYRKSVKLGKGIKLNISESGVSTTLGGKGLSVNVGKNGTYLNTSIPGTGLHNRKKISGEINAASNSNNYTKSFQIEEEDVINLSMIKNKEKTVVIGLFISSIILFKVYIGLLILPFAIIRMNKYLKSESRKIINDYNRSIVLIENEKYDEALKLLKNKKDLESLRLLIILGYQYKNDYKLTEKNAELYLKEVDDPFIELLYLSSLYQQEKFEIVDRLQKLENKLTSSFERQRLELLGFCFKQLKMYESALKIGRDLKLKYGKNKELETDYNFFIGQCEFYLGHKKKAKTLLSKVYAINASYEGLEEFEDFIKE